MTIPDWDFLGNTIVTNNYVRLTPDDQSKSGALWNSVVGTLLIFFRLTIDIIRKTTI